MIRINLKHYVSDRIERIKRPGKIPVPIKLVTSSTPTNNLATLVTSIKLSDNQSLLVEALADFKFYSSFPIKKRTKFSSLSRVNSLF